MKDERETYINYSIFGKGKVFWLKGRMICREKVIEVKGPKARCAQSVVRDVIFVQLPVKRTSWYSRQLKRTKDLRTTYKITVTTGKGNQKCIKNTYLKYPKEKIRNLKLQNDLLGNVNLNLLCPRLESRGKGPPRRNLSTSRPRRSGHRNP